MLLQVRALLVDQSVRVHGLYVSFGRRLSGAGDGEEQQNAGENRQGAEQRPILVQRERELTGVAMIAALGGRRSATTAR